MIKYLGSKRRLVPVLADVNRSLKRVLADDQNALLERLGLDA